MATSSMADRVGRVLGDRYRLVAPIGRGASAQVFLAEDVTLRRRVAVKVLHAALTEDDAFLRRFRAEAQQAAALGHPNVMRVFDWGESGDGPYLVLEHLGGGSLRDLLDAGHLLSPAQAARVGLDAARALDYAHRRGLVHRDIKPANLLFDDEGRLCIADFGLARALAEAAWTEPAGTWLGTARYASPEQAQGLSVDGRADVYSLALVLVEAVTGQVPFSADTTIATLMARVGATLEAPPALGPLAPVVEAAAHPDPAERLDARRLVADLEGVGRDLPAAEPLPLVHRREVADTVVLDGRPDDLTAMGVRAASGRLQAEADDDTTSLVADPGAPVPGPDLLPAGVRRRRWPWAVLAAVALLVGGGIAYALVQSAVPDHPVPSLRGKTLPEARAEVADEDFGVEVGERRFDEAVPKGQIVEQDPSLGRLKEGRSITVVVSRGPAPREVPDLAGVDQATAQQRLTEDGFVAKFTAAHHEEKPKGAVLDWVPKGTQEKGTEVLVTVSDGPTPREVPDVAGATYEEAAAALAGAQLKAVRNEVFSNDVTAGKVVSTKPGAGKPVPRDSEVTVNVSKGPDVVSVPNVIGKTEEEARAALDAAGLRVSGVFGPGRPGRRVIATAPQAGATVPRGTGVDLYVR